jgi:hypothetical protein
MSIKMLGSPFMEMINMKDAKLGLKGRCCCNLLTYWLQNKFSMTDSMLKIVVHYQFLIHMKTSSYISSHHPFFHDYLLFCFVLFCTKLQVLFL